MKRKKHKQFNCVDTNDAFCYEHAVLRHVDEMPERSQIAAERKKIIRNTLADTTNV